MRVESMKKQICRQYAISHPRLDSKHITLALMLTAILTATLTLTVQIKPVAGATTIHVPGDYPTIQAAVNAATPGDRIEVAPGTYHDNVDISTRSLTIVGANPDTTIVDGSQTDSVFKINVLTHPAGITIAGFTIRNPGESRAAITMQNGPPSADDNNNITNNIIQNSGDGIDVGYSNYNTISGNTFLNNSIYAVYLNNAGHNNINRNTISESSAGIKLATSTSNTIQNNTIYNTFSKTDYGIFLTATSTGNTINGNIVSARTAAIELVGSDSNTVHHNTVEGPSAYGIWLSNCRYGLIYYNTVKNDTSGIRLTWDSPGPTPSFHNVKNNKMAVNGVGIEVTKSNNNTFSGNWLQDNTWGVSLSSSAYNTLYHNNFIHNTDQLTSSGINYLYNASQGNHWSDYTGQDPDGDGIGDTPYTISGITDKYPLMTTWSEHDVAVTSVSVSTNQATPGTIIIITVKVRNNDNITATETFTVTTKYNSTLIGTQQVTSLAKGATQTLTFNWDTTGLGGKYTITAVASAVPNELNTDNNAYNSISVKIFLLGDINRDGTVNNSDLIILDQAYGTILGELNYNPDADLNKDNKIDLKDLNLLSKNYGKTI